MLFEKELYQKNFLNEYLEIIEGDYIQKIIVKFSSIFLFFFTTSLILLPQKNIYNMIQLLFFLVHETAKFVSTKEY